MKYSNLFGKTVKTAPAAAKSINHQLLVRGGFVDQLMSGSYTLLPLGWRVVNKINAIIRQEMNSTGAKEVLMPLLHPREIWNETGRWESAREVMYQFKDHRGKEYALSFTHEEIVMDLVRKHVRSYQDLPVKIYHFSTKFRHELRAKSGILRGREFMMKDLYSVHASEADLQSYYQLMKQSYLAVFSRIGLSARVIEAAGGVFTQSHTHEFQVIAKSGEDTIYYCDQCDWGQNYEVFERGESDTCPQCRRGKVIKAASIEVGNIFPLGQLYSQKMNVTFTDRDGKQKHPWFGSYGIGPTRVMGTIVEVSHDERGIIWPAAVAPYQVHLVTINHQQSTINEIALEIYKRLETSGIEVLWDDRINASAGEKFADADLIGIPWRLVISERTGDKVEVKRRDEEEAKLVSVNDLINQIIMKTKKH